MRNDELMLPWLERLRHELPRLELFDVHTHIGQNDPDGYRSSEAQLLEALALAGARAAVFPMHEPGGYPPANDAVIAAAQRSGGRLTAFCRLDPAADPLAEAQRCLAAGGGGIKLHPRAEQFALDDPALSGVWELADAERLPVLAHAGRGIPALGEHALELTARYPGLRLILAHAAVSDLGLVAPHAAEHPNLFFDTSWWSPVDLLALFALVPPGQVLLASDMPYGSPVEMSIVGLRCGLQAGLGEEALRAVAGLQAGRLIGREDPLECGPAPGARAAIHPLLERVASYLTLGVGLLLRGGDGSEVLALARHACAVAPSVPHAEVFAAVEELIGTAESRGGRAGLDLLVLALAVARTPDVALP
jgi:predicted TIM-barrel fold metal-dependent hydrolase